MTSLSAVFWPAFTLLVVAVRYAAGWFCGAPICFPLGRATERFVCYIVTIAPEVAGRIVQLNVDRQSICP